MELWNDIATEKSQNLLSELKKLTDFVLIGGWATWLYSHASKSKDIDIYINFDDFFKLQNLFAKQGIQISLNEKLNKYEAKIGEIDIDIYTPHHCSLIIPCKDIFEKKWFRKVEQFSVVIPEILLLLKIKAEEDRHETMKGFKDRIDILSILYSTEIDNNLLRSLAEKYNITLEILKNIIKDSNKEYSYFFEKSGNLSELKKLKKELLRNIS